MTCPHCGVTATAIDGHCPSCGKPAQPDTRGVVPPDADVTQIPAPRPFTSDLGGIDQAATFLPSVTGQSSRPTVSRQSDFGSVLPTGATKSGIPNSTGPLAPGQSFGPRYHVIRLLGAGGMGAVYQAWDEELGVSVAIKVIRPEIVADPTASEDLERRFKRELLLARQVTHKNVVRIHDLGEIDGIKYITMPYVQGSSLASVLRKHGTLPVSRALALTKQVVSGLAAAHEAGVVHRDLKPENIMVDGDHALIMDFGIARASTGTDGTRSGMVVGTIGYMAPEQARGGDVDQRADIYACGLVLYDMLAGQVRFAGGQTAVGELFERMSHAPRPLKEINPDVPAAIDAIVSRCVQPEPANRYQKASELLRDLEQLSPDGHQIQGSTLATAIPAGLTRPSVPTLGRFAPARAKWLLAGAVVLVLGITSAVLVRTGLITLPTRQVQGPIEATSLVVVPFRNVSGDVTLDSLGTGVSSLLQYQLGQSSRVRTVGADRVSQVLQDLRIGSNATLSPAELARIADLTNARTILSGDIMRTGGTQIRLTANLQNLDSGETIPLTTLAASEAGIENAISELAAAVRERLARGSADVLSELKATSWKPSTRSLDALRLYTEGQTLTQQGNHQGALKRFQAATAEDDAFALGFSALARSYATLGFDEEAAQASRRAMTLSEGTQPQEKLLISANHYQILGDTPKAIEAYANLSKAWPNTPMVFFQLGELYERAGDYDQARAQLAQVVNLDPKFLEGLLALGRVEIRRGQPQESLAPLNSALTLAIDLRNDEARANILQASGIAYKRMNRLDEALPRYEESLAIKTRLGEKRGMAASLDEIAQVQRTLGNVRESERRYNEALKLRREIGERSGIANTLVNLAGLLNQGLGRPDDALPLLREALQIRRDSGNQASVALILNNIGNIYLAKGEYAEAQTNFERALELREKTKVARDIAESRHNLAETLSKMGRFDQALIHYHAALDLHRNAKNPRGAAIESYSIGTIFDHQGRHGAAVKSKEEALKTFNELKERDMWLSEILGGYGNSLTLSGRMDEARKPLDDAMDVANELKNANLMAQTLAFHADRAYFAGDSKTARQLADKAAEAAAKGSDPGFAVIARVAVALASASLQPSREVAQQLRMASVEAERLGLQYVALQSLIHSADTLLKFGDRAGARQAIERALGRSEVLGLRLLQAKAHYVRATILRLEGNRDARRDYATAVRLIDELRKEDGNQQLLKRADLGALHADATRWSTAK